MHPRKKWTKYQLTRPGQVVILCQRGLKGGGEKTPAVILDPSESGHQLQIPPGREGDTRLVRTFGTFSDVRLVNIAQLAEYTASDALINSETYRLAQHYIRTQGIASQRALLPTSFAPPPGPTAVSSRRARCAPPTPKRSRSSEPHCEDPTAQSIKLMLSLKPPVVTAIIVAGSSSGSGSASGSASTDVNMPDTPDSVAAAGSSAGGTGSAAATAGASGSGGAGAAQGAEGLFSNTAFRMLAEEAGITAELQASLQRRLNEEEDVAGIIAQMKEVQGRTAQVREKCRQLNVIIQQFESEETCETKADTLASEIAHLEAMKARSVDEIRQNTTRLAQQKDSLSKLPQTAPANAPAQAPHQSMFR